MGNNQSKMKQCSCYPEKLQHEKLPFALDLQGVGDYYTDPQIEEDLELLGSITNDHELEIEEDWELWGSITNDHELEIEEDLELLGSITNDHELEIKKMTACTSGVEVQIQICDLMTNIWTMPIKIRHFVNYFASGGERYAYKAFYSDSKGMLNLNDPMVLKIPKDINMMDEASRRAQAMMQARCQGYANNYNSMGVPKHVNFLKSQLVKFIDGTWTGRYATIEKYIDGTYEKHNIANPWNDKFALTLRNTPQAFSHFTYEYSGRTEVVVDIQGVGDFYTDPQIYLVSQSYGLSYYIGNEGIDHFCKNHECNAICKSLGLKKIENGRPFTPNTMVNGLGTMPRNESSYNVAPITTNTRIIPTIANTYANAPMWNMALYPSPYTVAPMWNTALYSSPYPPAPMTNGIVASSFYSSPYPMA